MSAGSRIEDASDPSTSPTLAERVGGPLIKPGNKFEPGKVGAEAAKPGERATTALKAAGDQIRTSVQKFGDTVRKLTGNGGKSSGDSEAGASAGGPDASGASAGQQWRHRRIGRIIEVTSRQSAPSTAEGADCCPPDSRKYLAPRTQTAAAAFPRMVPPQLIAGATDIEWPAKPTRSAPSDRNPKFCVNAG